MKKMNSLQQRVIITVKHDYDNLSYVVKIILPV